MKIKRTLKRLVGLILIVLAIAYVTFLVVTRPSNDRDWSRDMAVLPYATRDGTLVTINNIRDIAYRSVLDYDLRYYDKTFDTSKLRVAYLFVDPFGAFSAHTMLGFEWEDKTRVVLSVEVRREQNEWFSGWKGLFRKFEIMYVWADETDVVKLRTNVRKDAVYMYRLNMAQENVVRLFEDAIERTNELAENPEFYNTLSNNCTTNLISHLQRVYEKNFVFDWRYYIPGYADELGMKYGLIDEKKELVDLRVAHNISPQALSCGDCQDYSGTIHRQ